MKNKPIIIIGAGISGLTLALALLKNNISVLIFEKEKEIEDYISTGDWNGKAGAYGIQGSASKFIPWIAGSFSAIVGLPLFETDNLLSEAGYTIRKVKE